MNYFAPPPRWCSELGCENTQAARSNYCVDHRPGLIEDTQHSHRGPTEGSWHGPDKVAHALFILAITGWAAVYGYGQLGWGVAIILGAVWEVSNQWLVGKGPRGMSILDLLGFLVGGVGAGLLLWWAP